MYDPKTQRIEGFQKKCKKKTERTKQTNPKIKSKKKNNNKKKQKATATPRKNKKITWENAVLCFLCVFLVLFCFFGDSSLSSCFFGDVVFDFVVVFLLNPAFSVLQGIILVDLQ